MFVLQVCCVICEPHRQLKYCGNTTNLFSHLKNKHPRVYSNLQKPKQSTEASSSCSSKPPQSINRWFANQEKLRPDSPRAKELSKSVGYFIAKDMMPLNVVHVFSMITYNDKLIIMYQMCGFKLFSKIFLNILL